MTKILHISSEPPGDMSGGRLAVKQSILALQKLGQVDYVGPEIDNGEFTKKNINRTFYLKKQKSILCRILNILTLNFSVYYSSFRKIRKQIDWPSYDYVYVEFTKWLFAVKYAKKSNIKTIVRLLNIESDYSYNLFKIKKTILNYIQYKYHQYAERKIVKLADYIIALSETDKKRLLELYGDKNITDKIFIMPICVECNKLNIHAFDKNNINLLITGSLWYGPNYEGIEWFLKNVWIRIRDFCNLYIVGSNPNIDLIKIIQSDDKVNIIKNAPDVKEYFELADIYISPIFIGAGMKVKVAQAMSYGLPIIGTKHSFIGYEESENIYYIANDKNEFINYIEKIRQVSPEILSQIKCSVFDKFNNNYNIEVANNYLRALWKDTF